MLRTLAMTDQTPERDWIRAAQQEAAALPKDADGAARPDVRVPGYEIVRALGRGGQGVVCEAVQTATQRRVALKVIRADATEGARWARFQREVHLLARLNHPHVITVYDSGRSNGCYYYAMELIAGRRLDEHVFDAGLEQHATLRLFAAVCDAVHAAHQCGVLHRDLKPANILVDADGQPRVLDFGLAKPLFAEASCGQTATALTDDGRFLGSLNWASPEQVSGGAEQVDVRSDVYSLGVMLYELLTTVSPYDTSSGSLQAIVENITQVTPACPSTLDRSINSDVDAIVLRCLAKEPARRYGTVGELAADVRRYLNNEPIEARRDSHFYVLRKTLARHRVLTGAATLALLLGIGFGVVMTGMYSQARAAQVAAEQEAEGLRDQLRAIRDSLVEPQNWTSAFQTARALEKLPPDDAWQMLQSAWERMEDDHPKQQLLKAAWVAWYAYLPRVLHLGMTDESPDVQNWAINYLRGLAFTDFAEDYSAYQTWHGTFGALPIDEVLERNARRFVTELRALTPAARGKRLGQLDVSRSFRDREHVAKLALELGLADLLLHSITHAEAERDGIRAAGRVLRELPLPESVVRARILPLTEDERSEVQTLAVNVLGAQQARYAVEMLVRQTVELVGRRASIGISERATALGEIGDPRVIPDLIGIIAADTNDETLYDIGYFGLGELTGVRYDESHDGAWWRAWWEKNRMRFPEEVAKRDIPALTMSAPETDAAAHEGRIPADALRAAGNDRMAYLLHQPDRPAPAEGYRLLLVLPGGDGSADFRSFVERIGEQALGGRYLVAQLIAPQWDAAQSAQVVWPNHGLGYPAAEFVTEAFIRSVVADVGGRQRIDARHIYALGWSSGGPPVYAALLEKGSPLRGAFVAMSVFKPQGFDDLGAVQGKAVYILHSPDDFIAMRFPEAARDQLAEAGAKTRLATYQGGHGWHGDVFGNIRRGITWLEEQGVREGAQK